MGTIYSQAGSAKSKVGTSGGCGKRPPDFPMAEP